MFLGTIAQDQGRRNEIIPATILACIFGRGVGFDLTPPRGPRTLDGRMKKSPTFFLVPAIKPLSTRGRRPKGGPPLPGRRRYRGRSGAVTPGGGARGARTPTFYLSIAGRGIGARRGIILCKGARAVYFYLGASPRFRSTKGRVTWPQYQPKETLWNTATPTKGHWLLQSP